MSGKNDRENLSRSVLPWEWGAGCVVLDGRGQEMERDSVSTQELAKSGPAERRCKNVGFTRHAQTTEQRH